MASKGSVTVGTPSKGVITKGSSYTRGTWRIYVTGIESVVAELRIIAAKAANPAPGLAKIAQLFSIMEAQRFSTGGTAPEFGIGAPWLPLTDATISNRTGLGATGDQPLLAFGYLAKAATAPHIEPFGSKALRIIVNALNSGPSEEYSHGSDYGVYHQTGAGFNPKREFVTITPEFILYAVAAMGDWIMGMPDETADKDKSDIPVDFQLGTPKMGAKSKYHDFGGWLHDKRKLGPSEFDATYGSMTMPSSHNEGLAEAMNWDFKGSPTIDDATKARYSSYLKAYDQYQATPLHLKKK